jgi:hypothetical protein
MFIHAVCMRMHVTAPVLGIIETACHCSAPGCGDSCSRAREAARLKMITCRAVLHVPVRLVLQHGMMADKALTDTHR